MISTPEYIQQLRNCSACPQAAPFTPIGSLQARVALLFPYPQLELQLYPLEAPRFTQQLILSILSASNLLTKDVYITYGHYCMSAVKVSSDRCLVKLPFDRDLSLMPNLQMILSFGTIEYLAAYMLNHPLPHLIELPNIGRLFRKRSSLLPQVIQEASKEIAKVLSSI